MAHRSKEYDAMLHDTVALIAYEQPEVRQSAGAPLHIWFSTSLPVLCSHGMCCSPLLMLTVKQQLQTCVYEASGSNSKIIALHSTGV